MPAALTKSQYKGKLSTATEGTIALVGQYANYATATTHKCLKHNKVWNAIPNYILAYGKGCEACVSENTCKANLKKYKGRLKISHPTVKIVGRYIDSKTRLKHECTVHNTTWEVEPRQMNSKAIGCASCRSKLIAAKAKSLHPQKGVEYIARLAVLRPHLRLLGKFRAQRLKAKHLCLTHNVSWMVTPDNLLRSQKGCIECKRDASTESFHNNPDRFATKDYALGTRIVRVQGFEPLALDYLLAKGYTDSDILVATEKSIPVILWDKDGKTKRHYPDLFIKSRNMIVEVKSDFTFGLLGSKEWYRAIQAKTCSAKAQGHKYVVLVFNSAGQRIKLPKRWWLLSHKALLKRLT